MTPNAVMDVDQIQLSDPKFWGRPRDEREGACATLRAERPVIWQKELDDRLFPPGPGFWAVTKHADILEVSRNPEIYCSGKGATSSADMPPEFLEFFGSLINTDDPKHKRLRGLISAGFTPARLRKAEEVVRRAANSTINDIVDKGEGDFVTDIAAPYPIRIICDMVGIPESEHQFVFDMTNLILGGSDPEFISEDEDMAAKIFNAGFQLAEMMKTMREDRLKNPTDDLTSVLAHAEIDGERLTDRELGSFFILLVVAGNDTTRTALGQAIYALSQFPDQREILKNDFENLAPMAVEEILRWGTPVINMRRTATCDTELHGQKIAEGDKLLIWYCSGNRDEDVFDDPYVFDVRRTPNDHVAFGGPGPHFCLGANLARREISIMLGELFKRMPDMDVTGEPDYLQSLFINGIKHLPISWTPGKPV